MTNLEKYQSLLGPGKGLLLTSRFSRYYAAGFDIAEGIALVTTDKCFYFTDSRYIEAAQNNIKGFEVVEMNRQNPYKDLINNTCSQLDIVALGYEEDDLSASTLGMYTQELEAELYEIGYALAKFRIAKEPHELALMRKAQEITDEAFSQVLGCIREGMTEKQLLAELIYRLYLCGADGLAFDPIVVSGPNSSMPHGVPGDRKLQAGDFITLDFGAMYQGYCADMTRTVALGYATEEMKQVYNTVLQAQLAGIAATRAGMTGQEVDGAARKVIADAGYGEYFGHSYGHGIGMECHEMPGVSPAGNEPIPAGAVCSAEPGIYLPGKFGVRIEDLVIFTEEGCENITRSPKELIIV